MGRFGYHGKILHVDLATRRTWVEEPDDSFWRLYGGGGLLATYFLLRGTPRAIDPLSDENILIISSSVVAGHPYAGLARFTIGAKSPLTAGVGEARCEGPFGIALKGSGVDALLFHGAAEEPVVVVIQEGGSAFARVGIFGG